MNGGLVDKEGLREFICEESLSKPLFGQNTFELKKGKIVIDEDKIIITDIAKQQRLQMLLLAGSGMLLGTSYLIGYFKKGDQFGLWFICCASQYSDFCSLFSAVCNK